MHQVARGGAGGACLSEVGLEEVFHHPVLYIIPLPPCVGYEAVGVEGVACQAIHCVVQALLLEGILQAKISQISAGQLRPSADLLQHPMIPRSKASNLEAACRVCSLHKGPPQS